MKKKLFALAAAGCLLSCSYAMAAANVQSDIAGVEMNRLQQEQERAQVAQQMREDQDKLADSKPESGQSGKGEDQTGPRITILLKQVVTDPSEVLTDAELDEITGPYINKEVSEKELYAIKNAINALYEAKGYITCRAFLQPQNLNDGVLKITLIEGRSGETSIEGNKHTKKNYILNRMHLQTGTIPNMKVLTQDLLRFNITNDVRLKLRMQAGKSTGTTDYVLTVVEPKQDRYTLFVDNNGNHATGEFREGFYYTCRSLSGERDALNLGGIRSRGIGAFSTGYSRMINTRGDKMYVSYSTNSATQKDDFGTGGLYTKGHANSYGIGIIHPIVITPTKRMELSLDYTQLHSSSDVIFDMANWRNNNLDDTYKDFTLGFAMTNYTPSSVIYQKHNLIFGGVNKNGPYSSSDNDSFRYFIYRLDGFYQKRYQHGQMMTLRGSFQQADTSLRNASAKAFYLGGFYNVRGYRENYMGSSGGISLSAEYSIPLTKDRNTNVFLFTDYGRLFGEHVDSDNVDNQLWSIGLGIRTRICKCISLIWDIAKPLKTDFPGKKDHADSYRMNFILSAQF